MPKKQRSDSNKIEIKINPRVTVRTQPDYPLTEDDLKRINTIYNGALNYINKAIDELSYFIDYVNNPNNSDSLKLNHIS